MTLPQPDVKSIFGRALEIESAGGRALYLDEVCGNDAALRAEIEGLLANLERAAEFMRRPAAAVAPGATVDFDPVTEGPGAIIGPYKLLQQIGEGGMGVVYMAEQDQPVRRRVALKIIKPGMDSAQVIARFEAERQALALMDHPNIARVLEAGTTASCRPYFVMELVKGVPLTRFCDENRLTPIERLELFVPVCQAIQHAHQKGIIHRDIKPSNVMVTLYDGKPMPKVIDFGVAKATSQKLTDRTMFTAYGQIVGTLEYMSPEQAEMSGLDIDTRSDIYSLGVLLYELLTGSTPLSHNRLREIALVELLRLIREEEPPKPSTRLSDSGEALATISAQRKTEPAKLAKLLRGELDWIVMKALDKDRGRRYETANGLARDVERYLRDEPVEACPPSARYRLQKLVQKHKKMLVTVAAFAVLLMATTMFSSWQALRATRAEKLAQDERDAAVAAKETAQEESKRADREAAAAKAALAAEGRRREQTRAALDDLSSQVVEEWLAKQQDLSIENKEFLEKALASYEEFAVETGEDEKSRVGVAGAFQRIGNIRNLLGLNKEAEADYRRSLDLSSRLAQDFPKKPGYCSAVALLDRQLGTLFDRTGRPREAELAYRKALERQGQLIAEQPAKPNYRYLAALTNHDLGNLLTMKGQQEGEAFLRQALAQAKSLADAYPTRTDYRILWAMSSDHLGTTLRKTGRLQKAEVAYRDAQRMWQQLAKDQPANLDVRYWFADNYISLGVLWTRTKPSEAEAAFRSAMLLAQRLVGDFPGVPKYRLLLASNQQLLAGLLMDAGRFQDAKPIIQNALTIQKQLVKDFPSEIRCRIALGQTLNDLSCQLADLGRLKEAEAPLLDALNIRKQLVADVPGVPAYENDLAGTLVNFADFAVRQHRPAEAFHWLDEALPHHQAALRAVPDNPVYREYFRNNLGTRAEALIGLGDHAIAASLANDVAGLKFDAVSDSYMAAILLSRCSKVAENDAKLGKSRSLELAREYGARAVANLHKAVEGGFNDGAKLKTDNDLAAIRSRDDFQKLVQELAHKQAK